MIKAKVTYQGCSVNIPIDGRKLNIINLAEIEHKNPFWGDNILYGLSLISSYHTAPKINSREFLSLCDEEGINLLKLDLLYSSGKRYTVLYYPRYSLVGYEELLEEDGNYIQMDYNANPGTLIPKIPSLLDPCLIRSKNSIRGLRDIRELLYPNRHYGLLVWPGYSKVESAESYLSDPVEVIKEIDKRDNYSTIIINTSKL